MVYLAQRKETRPVQVRDIAQALGIPYPFLAKVVQSLSRAGMLNTTKGPGGGVLLGDDPEGMTLLGVVETIDGLDVTTECVLGIPECSDRAPCPLHDRWAGVRSAIIDMLGQESIADWADHLDRGRSLPGAG